MLCAIPYDLHGDQDLCLDPIYQYYQILIFLCLDVISPELSQLIREAHGDVDHVQNTNPKVEWPV